MNDSSRTAGRSPDSPTLLALAAGLAMGHVVAAMADPSVASSTTLPAAIVFLVFGAAGVVCALAALPRPRGPRPRIGRWIMAIGVGFLAALAPPLLF